MYDQKIKLARKDDNLCAFTFDANGSVVGDVYAFIVRNLPDGAGTLIFQVTSGGGQITITDAGSPGTPAVVQVDITDKVDTVPDQVDPLQYYWEFRRTNATREQRLAKGPFTIDPSLV